MMLRCALAARSTISRCWRTVGVQHWVSPVSVMCPAMPAAAFGTVYLSDGVTAVTAGTSYSLAQLQGMRFAATAEATGGPATFSWTVQDNGGTANGGSDTLNESLTISITPITFSGFLGFLNSTGGVSNEGIANALTEKVTHAVAEYNKGDFSAAKGDLDAFINQVQAQRGEHITKDAADQLLEYASFLLDQLP